MNRTQFIVLAVTTALLLAPFTTWQHLEARGLPYLEGLQLQRHQSIIDSEAGNPWQYRVLTAYMIEAITCLVARIGIDWPIAYTFIAFRVVQDALILLLAVEFYRQLGLSSALSFIGVSLLAWGMSYSHYDSDLQFATFLDVSFYLAAALLILNDKLPWLVPLTALAALNRETSGLIVGLPVIVAMFERQPLARPFAVSALSGLVYLGVFVALRLAYPPQDLLLPYGVRQGLPLLQYNILRPITWERLIATLGVIPLLAVIGYSSWSAQLKGLFWGIVPIWVVLHAFMSVMAESRLFLVPQAVIFIPAALYVARRNRGSLYAT